MVQDTLIVYFESRVPDAEKGTRRETLVYHYTPKSLEHLVEYSKLFPQQKITQVVRYRPEMPRRIFLTRQFRELCKGEA